MENTCAEPEGHPLVHSSATFRFRFENLNSPKNMPCANKLKISKGPWGSVNSSVVQNCVQVTPPEGDNAGLVCC
jgi:hypothetical protein